MRLRGWLLNRHVGCPAVTLRFSAPLGGRHLRQRLAQSVERVTDERGRAALRGGRRAGQLGTGRRRLAHELESTRPRA